MGRIVVTEFVSLDGVVEAPAESEDFEHGGWSFKTTRGDEGDQFKLDETLESEALLLGRVTFEGFAEAWPSRDGEFADKFNDMPKYVVSSTIEEPDWNNSTVLEGDVVEEVSKLKRRARRGHRGRRNPAARADAGRARPRRRASPDGLPGGPGSGKRLFGETSEMKGLRLSDSKMVGDGVAILVYEPAEQQ